MKDHVDELTAWDLKCIRGTIKAIEKVPETTVSQPKVDTTKIHSAKKVLGGYLQLGEPIDFIWNEKEKKEEDE